MPNISDQYGRFLAMQYPNSRLAQQRRVTAFRNPSTGNVQLGPPSGATNPNLTGPGGRDVGGGTAIADPRMGQRRGTGRAIPQMPDMNVGTPSREQMAGRRLAPPQTFMEKLQSFSASPYGQNMASGLSRGGVVTSNSTDFGGITGGINEIVQGMNQGSVAQTEADETARLKAEATALQAQRAGMDLNELMRDAMSRGDHQLVNAIANMLRATTPTASGANIPGPMQEVAAKTNQRALIRKMEQEILAGTMDENDPEYLEAKEVLKEMDLQFDPRDPAPIKPPDEFVMMNRVHERARKDYEARGKVYEEDVSPLSPNAQMMRARNGMLSVYETAEDGTLGDELANWNTQGRYATEAKVDKFDDILDYLDGDNIVTGPLIATLRLIGGDYLQAVVNEDSADALDIIRSIVFEGLREALGAQFTEREGQRLVDAAYNSALSPEMNKRRIKRLQVMAESSYNAKRLLAEYASTYGTTQGWERWAMEQDPDFARLMIRDGQTQLAGTTIEASDYAGLDDEMLTTAITNDTANLSAQEAGAVILRMSRDGMALEHPLMIALKART